MYKAIVEIGEYKVGDEVPADKAKFWLSVYVVPQVEEVSGKSTEKIEEVKVEEVKSEEPVISGSSILEDYLERKGSVVKKNILEDNLTNDQLEELLKLEKSDKNRSAVIFAIKKRIDN